MKLPKFDEFIQARDSLPVRDIDIFKLPSNLTPDEVVDFAERAAERTTMLVLEQYHRWLADRLSE